MQIGECLPLVASALVSRVYFWLGFFFLALAFVHQCAQLCSALSNFSPVFALKETVLRQQRCALPGEDRQEPAAQCCAFRVTQP